MKYILLCLLFTFSCNPSKPLNFKNFDFKAFKSDRGGCENKRVKLVSHLITNKDLLLGISENTIFDNFGRYDYQILDKKNEKLFVYFLEKGPQCSNIQNPTTAQCMIVSLNSVSLVKEVTFKKGNP